MRYQNPAGNFHPVKRVVELFRKVNNGKVLFPNVVKVPAQLSFKIIIMH